MDGGVGGDAGRTASLHRRHQRGADAHRRGGIPVSYFFTATIFYENVNPGGDFFLTLYVLQLLVENSPCQTSYLFVKND